MRLFRVGVLVAGLLLVSAQAALSASPIQQLTDNAAADVRPAWSADGTRSPSRATVASCTRCT
jgi:hypothetical protein